MSQTVRAIETLKMLLKGQGKTYKDLAITLRLTEAGIKKALNSDSLSLARAEDICAFLGISLFELMQMSKSESGGRQLVLNMEQEQALAADEELFVVYHLLLILPNVERICRDYKFSKSQLQKHFLKLHELGLASQKTSGQPYIKSDLNPTWIEDGPLMELYGQRLANEFVLGKNADHPYYVRFLRGKMGSATVEILKNKMQKLESEFCLLSTPPHEAGDEQVFALYHGIKAWNFSVLEKYRKSN